MRIVLPVGLAAALLGPTSARAGVKPNLVVASISTPVTHAQGSEKIKVHATTENLGDAAGGPSSTYFVLSKDKRVTGYDWYLGAHRVPALDPGERAEYSRASRLHDNIRGGDYYLLACADASKEVREQSETDNCRAARAKIKVEEFVDPYIEVSPPSHDFGEVSVGTTSAPFEFTLRNVGDGSIDMRGALLWPPAFPLTADCPGSLPAHSSCTVSVSFAPDRAGRFDEEFRIEAGDTFPPDVPVTGVGTDKR